MTVLGPYYTNQVPATVLGLSVIDGTGAVVNLSGYTSATLTLQDPTGTDIVTTGGVCTFTDAVNGKVTYSWPVVSLFATSGTYQLQLVLTGPNGVKDLTVIQQVLVKRAL